MLFIKTITVFMSITNILTIQCNLVTNTDDLTSIQINSKTFRFTPLKVGNRFVYIDSSWSGRDFEYGGAHYKRDSIRLEIIDNFSFNGHPSFSIEQNRYSKDSLHWQIVTADKVVDSIKVENSQSTNLDTLMVINDSLVGLHNFGTYFFKIIICPDSLIRKSVINGDSVAIAGNLFRIYAESYGLVYDYGTTIGHIHYGHKLCLTEFNNEKIEFKPN